MRNRIQRWFKTPAVAAVVGPPAVAAVPEHWNWGRILGTIGVIALIVWLALGGFTTVQSWLPKPAPVVAFDVDRDCKNAFDPATGYPLDKDLSRKNGKCEFPKPAAIAPIPTTSGSSVSTLCPSLAEARRIFEVDITLVGTESCAYSMNRADGSFVRIRMPRNWLVTSAERDELVYVQVGNDNNVEAKAATWRLMVAYPGLTLERQFELTAGYAALPQNQFVGSMRCRGCTGFTNPASMPANAGCPNVAGFTSSAIDGGCLYKAAAPSTFAIPLGWKAYYGIPAQWVESGSISNVTQVSLYRQ